MTDTRTASPAPPPPAGLRQRKKQRTREQLTRAALRLFLSQGYENTTVDQIAEAVEVSQRTFFRYFASKEEVALAPLTGVDDAFLAALGDRPPTESPLQAMRGAFRAVLDQVRSGEVAGVNADLHMAMMRLVESTPGLLAPRLRQTEEMEARLVAVIAAREGIDPEQDPRAHLIVAIFSAVGRVITRTRYQGDGPGAEDEANVDDIAAAMEAGLDRMGPDLFGSWR
ncbi:TetR/AcrR family transcriptional regulator [Streptomyces sp. URMC 123]|uniref:TetR/AcrR family transcriptional regulator n=1 Tax=Streptomyces sp. URMC 123 TaxID=3423403 RepID=UPI003F1D0A70